MRPQRGRDRRVGRGRARAGPGRVGRGAESLLVVKANQPTLHAQLAGLPWRQIPVMDRTRDHGHGGVELRSLKVAAVAGLCFPHAAQAIWLTRRVRASGSRRWRVVTVHAVTSLALGAASPAQLAGWLHGHWRIENRCTGSATWTAAKTPPPHAPAASSARWPPAPPRRRRAAPDRPSPTSPPRYDIPAATRPGRLPSSAWQTVETDITAR